MPASPSGKFVRPRSRLRVFLALFSLAPPAAAEDARPPGAVRVTYTDATCTSEAEFRESIRRRAPELVDAAPGEPARAFVARVERDARGRVRGSLDISEPSGVRITRRLEGDDCAEVVESLAFIVAELGRALHLEPDTPTPAPSPPPETRNPPPAPPQTPARRDEVASERARLRVESGVGVQAVHGPAPGFVLAPLLYAELGWAQGRRAPLISGRLSALYTKSSTIAGEIGDARIRWLAARAELCGPRLEGASLSLGGCASFDAGELTGEGRNSDNPKTQSALWLAPGLVARGRLTLERVLVLGVEVGGFIPLVRPTFYFAGSSGDEREVVYTVPSVGFFSGIGVGVLFP